MRWSKEYRVKRRKEIYGYLLSKGIPRRTVEDILGDLTNISLCEARDIKYDRMFAAISLALSRVLKFGPKRILMVLRCVDDIFISAENGHPWDLIMQDCRDETGFVIHTNEDERIWFEYMGNDEYTGTVVENKKEDDYAERETGTC